MVRYLFAFLSIWATAPHAQTVSAADPDGLYQSLVNVGVAARLGTDDFGDPNIKIHHGNTRFSVFFYDCDDGQDCRAIQFYVGYRIDGAWSPESANQWNETRRFAKAYVSTEGVARLELDVHTGRGGIASADFIDLYQRWTTTVTDFEETIGW